MTIIINKTAKIYIPGHSGLLGTSLIQLLRKEGYDNLLYRNSKELDLRVQADVDTFMDKERPDYVFLCAAKVGGIQANSKFGADFITDNILIETNIIRASRRVGVKKLLFFGTGCSYPKFAPQPMNEDYLFDGKVEPTNEPYALAKLAGLVMCKAYRQQYGCNYIIAIPANLYGPGDNFAPNNSHVIPAMIRKFHEAKINGDKEVILWGTGSPLREFLYVDDCAKACLFLMNNYDGSEPVNIGSGQEISIKELANIIKEVVHYKGNIVWDTTKPDGSPRKLLDNGKIKYLGWEAQNQIQVNLNLIYKYYLKKELIIDEADN